MYTSLYSPPLPEKRGNANSEDVSNKNAGQQLLNFVRLIENDSGREAEGYMEQTVELMNNLIKLYFRHGLLQGDKIRAQQLLSHTSQNNNSSRKNIDKNDSRLHERVEPDSVGSGEENLILTALIRILSGETCDKLETQGYASDAALLVALSSELCFGICKHATASPVSDLCSQAVCNLLVQVGKPILNGLVSKIRWVEGGVKDFSAETGLRLRLLESSLTMACLDEVNHATPLTSCFKAACALVNLFGMKLSRSVSLISDLKSLAWRFATVPNEEVQQAATKLLACLPLAGGVNRMAPVDIWNREVVDIVAMMTTILGVTGPVNKSMRASKDGQMSKDCKAVLDTWIAFLCQEISDQSLRASSLCIYLRGLKFAFNSFLAYDWMYPPTKNVLIEAQINVPMVLDLVESFLSYPVSAETLFYKTKKRVRDESVEGGLISPRTIVAQVANEVKALGHSILDTILASIGAPPLLPFAKRVIRICYASLLTSCSGAVRKVMDATSVMQLEGKKRRWLHSSIPLRTVAIRTTQKVLSSFGSDRTAKINAADRSSNARSDGELAIALVVGCLLEQVGEPVGDISDGECWGTFEERVVLICSSLDCLRAALSFCGGFLGQSTRSIIDSTTLSCLLKLAGTEPNDLLSWSPIKRRILELAYVSVLTPWNDGAATSIGYTLKQAASALSQDADKNVALAAREAMRVCDQFGVPRAPPLLRIVRTTFEDSNHESQVPQSAHTILNGIQTASMESREARRAMEKSEELKRKQKRQLEKAQEDTKKRSRRRSPDESSMGQFNKMPQGSNEISKQKAKVKNPTDSIVVSETKEMEGSLASEAVPKKDTEENAVEDGKSKDNQVSETKEMEERQASEALSKKITEEKSKDNLFEEKSDTADENLAQTDEFDDDDFPDIVDGGPDSDDE